MEIFMITKHIASKKTNDFKLNVTYNNYLSVNKVFISLQQCSSILDVGARESLSDVVSKTLKKMLSQPEGKEEELDDTLLT